MQNIFNNHLRQLALLVLIIMLGVLLVTTLYVFLPGLLGGITTYILLRKWYFALTVNKKWRRGFTAVLFITAFIVVIAIPVYFTVLLVSPKISLLINNQDDAIRSLEIFSKKLEVYTGQQLFTPANAASFTKTMYGYAPSFLNSTANVLSNFCMMFFFLYYFLYSGKEIEQYLRRIIPLSPDDLRKLANETDVMIRASALGIPIVSFAHGAVAAIGFLVLGIPNWGILSFLTGVFAFMPFVGIMVVWVPMTVYLYSINQNFAATGLMIYSVAITGNVDYITRLGLLKKLGNIHPMITVFGIIVGLKLFGFMGLIFGPLLISYFILLVKIYTKEFATLAVLE